jgi:hypothetical protein
MRGSQTRIRLTLRATASWTRPARLLVATTLVANVESKAKAVSAALGVWHVKADELKGSPGGGIDSSSLSCCVR